MYTTQPCSVPQSWYMPDCWDWHMYLKQAHTRAGIIWFVHDDKELQVFSVPPFKILFFYTVIWSPFFVIWWREWLKVHGLSPELNRVHLHAVEQLGCVLTAWEWVWPCIWSQIKPNPKRSVNSKDTKTVECGNHYSVLFITLHTTTESLVHIQPLMS